MPEPARTAVKIMLRGSSLFNNTPLIVKLLDAHALLPGRLPSCKAAAGIHPNDDAVHVDVLSMHPSKRIIKHRWKFCQKKSLTELFLNSMNNVEHVLCKVKLKAIY